MAEKSIVTSARRVYAKDLHDEYFSMNVRIDSDELEHGDIVTVRVRKDDGDIEEGGGDNGYDGGDIGV